MQACSLLSGKAKAMAQLSKRRTKSTVFLSPKHREIISNSKKTVQRFFEDLIDFCSDHDMFSWKDGEFFFRHARIVIVRSDFLNNLCDALPEPYDTGRKLGERTRHAYAAVWNLDPSKPDHRQSYYNSIARNFGWGILSERPPNKIFIQAPCIQNEPFYRGLLEGILSLKLRTIHQSSDQIIFEILNKEKTENTPISQVARSAR